MGQLSEFSTTDLPVIDPARFAHKGDPCTYCGTPHDEVEPGSCPARLNNRIISICLDGPIPEFDRYKLHPQKYVESVLGLEVLEFHGTVMGSTVVMKVKKIHNDLPSFIQVLDEWPSWAKHQMEIGVTTDAY